MSSTFDLKDLYYKMLRIRRAEEEIAKRYSEQQMRCPVHLSIGQEAAAVGVAACLKPDDLVVSTHRAHAHYLAKGGRLTGLICELYGKADGCAKGQGGSMHLVDWSCGFAASTSIVGGTIPVGVGLAFAAHIQKKPQVTVVCIGDAAIEEGVFHESANFASLHKLPVLFVSENNLYSCYTHLRDRQPKRAITEVARGHGMRHMTLDGNDVNAITAEAAPMIESVRKGEGPAFLELETYRHLEHCGPNNDDHLDYRHPEEIKQWKDQDPLEIATAQLKAKNIWTTALADELEQKVKKEVMEAFDYALNAPFPERKELGAYIYASH
ncbi:MAG: thiamine pyrophosphate-dependent dehydrogenase E1 component subunit alpha [Bdellovibrionales bacterium]